MTDDSLTQFRLNRLEEAIESIATSLSKLAVLEERHNETRLALDRAFSELRECKMHVITQIGLLQERLDTIDKVRSHWPDLILTVAITSAVAYVSTRIFT